MIGRSMWVSCDGDETVMCDADWRGPGSARHRFEVRHGEGRVTVLPGHPAYCWNPSRHPAHFHTYVRWDGTSGRYACDGVPVPAAAAVPDRAAPTEDPALVIGALDNFIQDCIGRETVPPEYVTGAQRIRAALADGSLRLAPAAPTEGAGEVARQRIHDLHDGLARALAERDALRAENAALERQNEVQMQMVRQFAAERDALRDTVARIEALVEDPMLTVTAIGRRQLRAALVPPSPGEPE